MGIGQDLLVGLCRHREYRDLVTTELLDALGEKNAIVLPTGNQVAAANAVIDRVAPRSRALRRGCCRARPVARWIYGDGAFYGPYDGPRYYGSPGRRYAWSFLGLGR